MFWIGFGVGVVVAAVCIFFLLVWAFSTSHE